jgi:hypothetical protein
MKNMMRVVEETLRQDEVHTFQLDERLWYCALSVQNHGMNGIDSTSGSPGTRSCFELSGSPFEATPWCGGC